MNQLAVHLPAIILACGAVTVFICGALWPRYGLLFRGLALASVLLAGLSALGLAPENSSRLADAGPYARFFTVAVCALTALTLLFAGDYARRRNFERDEFHALILLSALGMVFLVTATDWILFAIGLETLSLPFYVLIAARLDKPRSLEAGIKYFVLGAAASAMVFLGIAFLYAASGSLELAQCMAGAGAGGIALTGMALVLAGLAFKLSLAPVHLWTPDVYQGAPAPVAAFLSGGAKLAVFAFLMRLALTQAPAWTAMEPVLWLAAALSLLLGTFGALTQDSLKRMLAYSSVSHMGFLALALLTVNTAGPAPAVFAAALFGLMDVGVFGALGLLSPLDEDADLLAGLRGMGRGHRLAGAGLAVSLATLAGLPPTAGFMSKLVVFKAALAAGYVWLCVLAVTAAVAGMYYILRVLAALYAPAPDTPPALPVPAWPALAGVVLAAALMVGFGVMPAGLLHQAAQALP